MSQKSDERSAYDVAPGFMDAAHRGVWDGVQTYLIGLALSAVLTAAAFYLAEAQLVWRPAIPVALSVLAVAQIGVHLVFFLHLTTAPDNVNNALALAFGALIVALVIGGSLWIMYHLNQNMLPMEQMEQMAPAQLARGSRALTAEGVVEPAGAASVDAGVSGLIQSVHCDVGRRVKAGQLCARIDPRAYAADVSQSENALRAAEAQLNKDAARLVSEQATPSERRSVEKAQTRVNRDRSKVAALRTAFDVAKANLANTDVVAPLDGVVRSRNVEPGQKVRPNPTKPLFVFTDDAGAVSIKAAVSGKDLEMLRLGDKATFVVEDFPDRYFPGVVTHISPPSQGAATADIVITAPNPDALLRPGMSAAIRLLVTDASRAP